MERNRLGNPDVGTAHQESLEADVDQYFKDLLGASSLGTPAATRIRDSAPGSTIGDVRRRLMKHENAACPRPPAPRSARAPAPVPFRLRSATTRSWLPQDRPDVSYDPLQLTRQALRDQRTRYILSWEAAAGPNAGSRARRETPGAPETLSAGTGFQFNVGQWPEPLSLSPRTARTPATPGFLALAAERDRLLGELADLRSGWPAMRLLVGYRNTLWDQAMRAIPLYRHAVDGGDGDARRVAGLANGRARQP